MSRIALFTVHLTDELKNDKVPCWDIVLDSLSAAVETFPVTRTISPSVISGFVDGVIADLETDQTFTTEEIREINKEVNNVLTSPENRSWVNFIEQSKDQLNYAEILGFNKNHQTYILEIENAEATPEHRAAKQPESN